MSHHFDTPTAREDPRLNVCDFYLFEGAPGATVMVMTVNPDAGLSSPSTFREEGLYAFRFDANADLREDVAFKVTFGVPLHDEGPKHRHVQNFVVRRMHGPAALKGVSGEVVARGRTGQSVTEGSVRCFAGLAPDLFAGDAAALGAFRKSLYQEHRFNPDAFQGRANFFAARNVTAIVLEVPNAMIGEGRIQAWATASLHGHAPEVQVSRWGYPLLTNIFMPDEEMKERFNRATPMDDQGEFMRQVGSVVETIVALNGSAADPAGYARGLVDRLFPAMLPYRLGTAASFGVGLINGRRLEDDAMDVMLAWATNTPLGDGVVPPVDRLRTGFPYIGPPYTAAEQRDVTPARPHGQPRTAPTTGDAR